MPRQTVKVGGRSCACAETFLELIEKQNYHTQLRLCFISLPNCLQLLLVPLISIYHSSILDLQ